MNGMWTIFRRELAGLFLTPLAWVVLCLALLVQGGFFLLYLDGYDGDVNGALSLALGEGIGFWMLLAILPPLLTMRMISEEARSGVLEFLLTAPLPDWAVIVGKTLAATAFMVLLWSSNIVYALVLQGAGGSPDWGQVAGGLMGACLVSGLFCSVGIVTSAVCSTPLLAAFLGVVLNVAMVVFPITGNLMPGPWRTWFDRLVQPFDLPAHLHTSFSQGAFDSADLVFFLVWISVALFTATRLVEARRWR